MASQHLKETAPGSVISAIPTSGEAASAGLEKKRMRGQRRGSKALLKWNKIHTSEDFIQLPETTLSFLPA